MSRQGKVRRIAYRLVTALTVGVFVLISVALTSAARASADDGPPIGSGNTCLTGAPN